MGELTRCRSTVSRLIVASQTRTRSGASPSIPTTTEAPWPDRISTYFDPQPFVSHAPTGSSEAQGSTPSNAASIRAPNAFTEHAVSTFGVIALVAGTCTGLW